MRDICVEMCLWHNLLEPLKVSDTETNDMEYQRCQTVETICIIAAIAVVALVIVIIASVLIHRQRRKRQPNAQQPNNQETEMAVIKDDEKTVRLTMTHIYIR